MRSDHLSKHLKTHQARRAQQQQQQQNQIQVQPNSNTEDNNTLIIAQNDLQLDSNESKPDLLR